MTVTTAIGVGRPGRCFARLEESAVQQFELPRDELTDREYGSRSSARLGNAQSISTSARAFQDSPDMTHRKVACTAVAQLRPKDHTIRLAAAVAG